MRRGINEPRRSLRRGSHFALLVCLGLASVACSPERSREPAPPRRIILFSMDTVRADHLSGFGGKASPKLYSIAEEGVRFTRCYAAGSYTLPAQMSVFTGLDPQQHGVVSMAARLAPEIATLAEILRSAGYRTHAFHEGAYVAAPFGFDRGFDSYEQRRQIAVVGDQLGEVLEQIRALRDEPYLLFLHTYAAHYPYGGWNRYAREHPERGLPSAAAIDQLRARARAGNARGFSPVERRWSVLFNHLAESHTAMIRGFDRLFFDDFTESRFFELDRRALQTSYDVRIRLIDDALGAIRDELVELRQWEDTLMIVFSDHGEAFFEHGFGRHTFAPFEEVLRVPLVISWPRVLRGGRGRAIDATVSHLDLFPTILGLAGIPIPEGRPGLDLSAALRGAGSLPANRAVYPAVLRIADLRQTPLRRVAVTPKRKFIEGHGEFGDAQGLLFDLDLDPGERHNLRADRPEVFAAMSREARAWSESLAKQPAPIHRKTGRRIRRLDPESEIDLSEAEKENLRALGYLRDR